MQIMERVESSIVFTLRVFVFDYLQARYLGLLVTLLGVFLLFLPTLRCLVLYLTSGLGLLVTGMIPDF
jgi:uncharacterized membrane protein HdeD (DUF308 family)